MRLVEANTQAWHRDNPRSFANASQAEAEAIKELINVIS